MMGGRMLEGVGFEQRMEEHQQQLPTLGKKRGRTLMEGGAILVDRNENKDEDVSLKTKKDAPASAKTKHANGRLHNALLEPIM